MAVENTAMFVIDREAPPGAKSEGYSIEDPPSYSTLGGSRAETGAVMAGDADVIIIGTPSA